MNNFIFSIAFSLFYLTIVQAKQPNPVDSLSNKNFQYFEESVIEFRMDSIKAQQFAKYWLKKANEEKNLVQQTKAYKALIHFVDKKYRMIYADSLLEKAIATKNNKIIRTMGSALKGNTFKDGNTNSWYVLEMAQKRAYARATLEILGLYEIGVKGEDEAEDFKKQ